MTDDLIKRLKKQLGWPAFKMAQELWPETLALVEAVGSDLDRPHWDDFVATYEAIDAWEKKAKELMGE